MVFVADGNCGCGGIGCTVCGAPVIVNEAEVEKSVANMAAKQARLDASIEMKNGYFMSKTIVFEQPPQDQIAG